MPPSRKLTSAPSVTVSARRTGPLAPAVISRTVWSAMPTSPATASVAGPCTASVPPAPETFRSPARLCAKPDAPSPYCKVPPVTSAEPPSTPITTSRPPDTVVLPANAPLAPVRNVVPATWFKLCSKPEPAALVNAVENA
ncbi:hypothetical protein D9M72_232530 [compost metagenome]